MSGASYVRTATFPLLSETGELLGSDEVADEATRFTKSEPRPRRESNPRQASIIGVITHSQTAAESRWKQRRSRILASDSQAQHCVAYEQHTAVWTIGSDAL